MGEKVVAGTFGLSDRQRYRDKLRQCLTGLERLLEEKRFDRPKNLMGLEIELNLAGPDGMPRMMNAQVLERIASRDFQTELAMFNLEVNIAPHRLGGRVFDRLAEEIRTSLAYAHRKASEVDAGIVMIGILPTLGREDLVSSNLSDVDRYTLLNDQIVAARGEDFELDIDGVERLVCRSASIAPEAACTSVQLHLQVTPGRFADVERRAGGRRPAGRGRSQLAVPVRARAVAGVEAPLFQQSTDTRPPELQAQGVRPRTWFGERWVTSAYDLFEENLRFFPPLLPICDEEDPLGVLDAGVYPSSPSWCCTTARCTAGTGPCTASPTASRICASRTGCCPPARPSPTSSPTRRSTTGWCARSPRSRDRCGHDCPSRRPPRTSTRPAGTASTRAWRPRRGRYGGTTQVDAANLIRDELLPLAAAGLDAWGVEPADRDFYLGVIEGRCRLRVNGATWQAATFHRALEKGLGRDAALAATTRRYGELMHLGEPVHTWPVGLPEPVPLG